MFHHHTQAWGGLADRIQHPVDKHGLTVEDIDVVVGDFAVGAERQANLGHLFKHRTHLVKIGHTGGGVGGRPCRVKLHRLDQPASMGGGHIFSVGVFGQVERHQGIERHTFGQGSQNAISVGGGIRALNHRWHQIGHDDRTGEIAGGFGQDGLQHRAIAQMQVPVIGAGNGDGGAHGPALTQIYAEALEP